MKASKPHLRWEMYTEAGCNWLGIRTQGLYMHMNQTELATRKHKRLMATQWLPGFYFNPSLLHVLTMCVFLRQSQDNLPDPVCVYYRSQDQTRVTRLVWPVLSPAQPSLQLDFIIFNLPVNSDKQRPFSVSTGVSLWFLSLSPFMWWITLTVLACWAIPKSLWCNQLDQSEWPFWYDLEFSLPVFYWKFLHLRSSQRLQTPVCVGGGCVCVGCVCVCERERHRKRQRHRERRQIENANLLSEQYNKVYWKTEENKSGIVFMTQAEQSKSHFCSRQS